MELSRAKEILKQDWVVYDWVDEEDIEAIDTVLQALDNSISKEYYEMTTKDLSNIINDLKARLDNSISKDEVKRVYEDYAERIRYYDDNNIKHDDTYYEYVKICDVLLELLGE